ncbi:type II secretion system protein [Sulfurovum sp. bin170]|uniref:type IV pilus modification PilV family protein n=1 Tax=Sulfurovum sp. bin170 TaxID=2695268 RepID=UPI0013E0699D|nr:type II secretion system protein [Sulfurovum sp. bin170]NEW60099.1 type II secretion system protein [Sulfurovum sp. bin170]
MVDKRDNIWKRRVYSRTTEAKPSDSECYKKDSLESETLVPNITRLKPSVPMKKKRRGIAMVELIFALVIMGIVLMSAPMLIQQSIKSGNVALQQEAISAAASQTAIVLSMHWDEHNNSNLAGSSPMLDANRAPFDFNVTDAPLGLIGVSGRKSSKDGQTFIPSAVFGMDESDNPEYNESDFTDFDDVDDYHDTNFGLIVFNTEETSADVGDYVDIDINMSTEINYAEDRVDTGETDDLNGTTINLTNKINNTEIGVISNIKFIRVNLTSDSGIEELEKNITMEAFSCNIGTSLPQGEMKP